MRCKICGRTEDELEEEFGQKTVIKKHQNVMKCSKCIREYVIEAHSSGDDSDTLDEAWRI